MKDGVILINTSRGPLIKEEDLAKALHEGKVYAAACDVVSTEPIRPDNPLLGCYNSILTPHIAWAPKESRQRLMAHRSNRSTRGANRPLVPRPSFTTGTNGAVPVV